MINQVFSERMILAVTGGRKVLVINGCMLILAFIVAVEGVYLHWKFLGRFSPEDSFFFFLPLVVAFIVRNKKCSSAFLCFYLFFIILFGSISLRMHFGTYNSIGVKDPLQGLLFFDVPSVLCLVIYVVFAMTRALVRVFSARSD